MECIKINDKTSIYEKSKNISIPKKSSFENMLILDEYKLMSNFFDPTKGSPPNNWNSRLKLRINNYSVSSDLNKLCKE